VLRANWPANGQEPSVNAAEPTTVLLLLLLLFAA
jgi:hypothetical protein